MTTSPRARPTTNEAPAIPDLGLSALSLAQQYAFEYLGAVSWQQRCRLLEQEDTHMSFTTIGIGGRKVERDGTGSVQAR